MSDSFIVLTGDGGLIRCEGGGGERRFKDESTFSRDSSNLGQKFETRGENVNAGISGMKDRYIHCYISASFPSISSSSIFALFPLFFPLDFFHPFHLIFTWTQFLLSFSSFSSFLFFSFLSFLIFLSSLCVVHYFPFRCDLRHVFHG